MTEKSYALQVYIDTLLALDEKAEFPIGGLLEEAIVELHCELGMSDYRKTKKITSVQVEGHRITSGTISASDINGNTV